MDVQALVLLVLSFKTSILAIAHSNNTLPTGGTMMVRTKEIISHTMCGLDKFAIGGFGLSELVPRLRMVVVLLLGESLTAADLVGPISACLLALCADADGLRTRACCSAINLST